MLADPGEELAWLETTLRDMETKGEKAILLGHMSPRSCLKSWSLRFQALMERFQHVVRFGLFGHTHDETFQLMRNVNLEGDLTHTKPILFLSMMAPTTTYTGKNPSFAVYDIDEETMLIKDINVYYFDIAKANQGQPAWEHYHNILQDFQIEDASPSNFEAFARRTLTEEDLAKKAIGWASKGGPDGLRDSCDSGCRKGIFCDFVTSYTEDSQACSNG